ncbi:Cell division coordinator CpoB [subsurface metagenome]
MLIKCRECRKEIKVPDEWYNKYQGKMARCPYCKDKTLVSASEPGIIPKPEPEPQPEPTSNPAPKPKPISRLSKLRQMKSKRLGYSPSAKGTDSKKPRLLIMAGGLIMILVVAISIFMLIGRGDDENKKKEELNNLKNQNQKLIAKINELKHKVSSNTTGQELSNNSQDGLLDKLKTLEEEKEIIEQRIEEAEEHSEPQIRTDSIGRFVSAETIYEENNKATVVIITNDKNGQLLAQGSGFIVRSDGAIVTNLHVISDATSIKIKTHTGKYLEVIGILYVDSSNDVVILKAKGENLPVVTIGNSEQIKIGEKVYVIGSPMGLENTISEGIVGGIRKTSKISNKRKVIQISAPVSHGSSGGPVFNARGKVIGIATSMLKGAQNINFAMPVNVVKRKINKKEIIVLEKVPTMACNPDYWFWIGYHLYKAGKYKEAIVAYRRAIQIKPNYAEAYLTMGVTYEKLGRWEEVIDSYKKVIDLNPGWDLSVIYTDIGAAYGNLRNNREAIQWFKKAIEIKPDYADAHFNLGESYGRLDNYKKAIESFKKVIELKPKDVEAHAKLGIIYVLINEKDKALSEYRIIKKLDRRVADKLLTIIKQLK